jgi:pimeloyl-ACP methyl ester carboxylesterase
MVKRITLMSICLLFVGKTFSQQHTYGSFYTNDAYVNYILSKNKSEAAAIVMVPGLNLSTYIYSTTPDGRKGWAELFADKGYDVYMVNDPKFDFATGGFIAPYTIPINGKTATPGSVQGWQTDIWRRWGFGNSEGNPYPDALFPTDSFAAFERNYPFLGSSNIAYEDAIQSVIDTIGSKVWLLAHSAGTQPVVKAATQKKALINGLILIEPAGPPDSTNFPDLNGMHMFGVYGDYISSRNQTNRKLSTESAASLFNNAGGIADVVSLPEDSSVFGNSHILMQDKNSEYIFDIIDQWLKQFSTNALNVVKNTEETFHFELYPNPTTEEVWVNKKSMDGHDFTIYSVDGRILKQATILNQRVDLSDMPNGLLFLKFELNEQVIVKKVIKN